MIWKIKMKLEKLMLIHQCSWLKPVSLGGPTFLSFEWKHKQKEDPGKDWLNLVHCQTLILAEYRHLQVILNNRVSLKGLYFCVHCIILAPSKVHQHYLRLLWVNRDLDQFKNSLKYKRQHNHPNNGFRCLQKALSSQLRLPGMASAALATEKINT